MSRFTRFAVVLFSALALVNSTGAAPLKAKRMPAVTQTAADFKELDYSQFQISDGVAGNAAAEANAVFVDPFANTDLSTVSSDVLDAMNAMRTAAEDAETDQFNPAIAAASGAAADALQVGKIKNKVLKLTGEVQVLNIKIAQAQASGSDTSDLESKLATEQGKLTNNIATDTSSAGATSQGVVASSGAGASAASAAAPAAAASSAVASSAATPSAKKSKAKASSAAAASATASASTVASAAASASAAPASATNAAVTQSAANFKELDYAQFQISDGVAGNAAAEANAVFVDPFAGTDLSTVSSDVLDALNAMAKAAVDAETAQFNPAIDAASGAAADALEVGKVKNKVLKLTGEVQVLNVKIAQAKAAGSDTSDLESSLATEQGKLDKDTALDVASAGQTSQGVA